MLIALFAFLFLGGGSGTSELLADLKDFEKAAKQQIVEPAQREQLLATIKLMRSATKDYSKARSKSAKALAKFTKEHEQNTDAINAILQEAEENTTRFQRLILDQLDVLKATVSKEQWESLMLRSDV